MTSNGSVGNSASSSYPSDDMDTFFDFTQAENLYAPSDAMSPTSKVSPATTTIDPQRAFMSQDHADEQNQSFAGPSHEYDRFHQQTGLPTGSVSTVSAMNDFGQFSMGGYNSGIGMDMDFETSPSSMPPFFYPGESSGLDDLVDPSALGPEQSSQPTMQRLRPGMHSQQAQQAKAEAVARQQRQQQMGQQIMQQRNQSVASSQNATRANRARSQGSTGSADPAVDERISQLLDQMRHNGSIPEGDSQDSSNTLPSVLRNRRDEDDMDDDERLLASEEGKKLSSKERRQLRNKVSARAFRSRRKEYIQQLEGEVAAKAQEANELKMRNRQLMDQNNQLTQLTQTLLRHPAFATFMEDMSNDPSILASIQQQQQQQQIPVQSNAPIPSSSTKDVNPNRAMKQEPQHQQDVHVGMTMIPDQHLDFSNLTLGSNAWNGNAAFNFQQPQVFAVFETPALPNVEELTAQALSGKPSKSCDEPEPAKADFPVINNKDTLSIPAAESVEVVSAEDVDESDVCDDPAFALFVRSTASRSASRKTCSIKDAARMVEQSLSGKVPFTFTVEIESSSSSSSEGQFAEIDRLFAAESSVVKRVRAITSEYL